MNDTNGIYSDWPGETVYVCCRLTGILYPNTVRLSVPPHIGWYIILCKKTQRHLEAYDLDDLSDDAPGLLVWILTIACITAHKSE